MNIVQPPIYDLIPASVLTTQGDIVVRGAAQPGRLALGTALQLLRVKADLTGLEYGDPTGMFQKCRAYKGDADQLMPAGARNNITLSATTFDSNNIFSNTYDYITPTKPGYYIVHACSSVYMQDETGYHAIEVHRNGVLYAYDYQEKLTVDHREIFSHISTIMYLDGIDDHVSMKIWVQYGATQIYVKKGETVTYLEVLGPF